MRRIWRSEETLIKIWVWRGQDPDKDLERRICKDLSGTLGSARCASSSPASSFPASYLSGEDLGLDLGMIARAASLHSEFGHSDPSAASPTVSVPALPGPLHVSLQDGRAIWPLRFAVNSSRIFRNVTPSNAKWLKISLGEDLGLDLGKIWSLIWVWIWA